MILRRYISYLFGISFCGLMLSGCVEFKEITLYDGTEPRPILEKPETISSLVEPIIFEDDPKDTWGIVDQDIGKGECGVSKLTTEYVHSGAVAMDLTWNRDANDCEFAGVGIGWDNYAGKDISGLMDFAAIEFYVRSKQGRMFGLPIVLTFEDYSGGMGFCYTDNKYFERTAIDEVYQRVVVPLSSFDLEKENLDVTNIKQLQLELQQSGSIYLDDIRLVFYEAQEQTPWMVEEELPDPLATPIDIFSDAFIRNNGWGIMSDECRQVKLSEKESYDGVKSIHAKWDEKEGCKDLFFGASWNAWKPIDITSAMNTHAFKFMVRNNEAVSDELPLQFGMQDYNQTGILIKITSKYLSEGQFDSEWREVIVPFSTFEGESGFNNIDDRDKEAEFDYSKVKSMGFELLQSGDLYIDDIQIITLKSD